MKKKFNENSVSMMFYDNDKFGKEQENVDESRYKIVLIFQKNDIYQIKRVVLPG